MLRPITCAALRLTSSSIQLPKGTALSNPQPQLKKYERLPQSHPVLTIARAKDCTQSTERPIRLECLSRLASCCPSPKIRPVGLGRARRSRKLLLLSLQRRIRRLSQKRLLGKRQRKPTLSRLLEVWLSNRSQRLRTTSSPYSKLRLSRVAAALMKVPLPPKSLPTSRLQVKQWRVSEKRLMAMTEWLLRLQRVELLGTPQSYISRELSLNTTNAVSLRSSTRSSSPPTLRSSSSGDCFGSTRSPSSCTPWLGKLSRLTHLYPCSMIQYKYGGQNTQLKKRRPPIEQRPLSSQVVGV